MEPQSLQREEAWLVQSVFKTSDNVHFSPPMDSQCCSPSTTTATVR